MNISKFQSEDMSALKKVFEQQLQNHFNELIQVIPGIKKIQWTSSQEDENLYMVTEFDITKHNGYHYHYEAYKSNDDSLVGTEFTEEELSLLDDFMEYLDCSSPALVVLFGNFTFSLTTE